MDWLQRTEKLIGKDNLNKIKNSRIIILGLGGVGGACLEGLCRAGINNFMLIDNDIIDVTNLNRQIITTFNTIGESKVEIAKKRVLSINKNCNITTLKEFYNKNIDDILLSFKPDFIVDCIDTVTSKLDLAQMCYHNKIPSIMCLGTGNRLNPFLFKFGDINDTIGSGCNFSKIIRKKLNDFGIYKYNVLFSTEPAQKIKTLSDEHGRHSPASISFCPPVAGYLISSYVINKLIK